MILIWRVLSLGDRVTSGEGSSVESPEAASGVIEDISLRWAQWDAAAQGNQDLVCKLR